MILATLLLSSYLGAGGSLTLPQGGTGCSTIGGAEVRMGTYLSDDWALEGSVLRQNQSWGFSAQALGHWSSWSVYDRFFGYSSFDPFVTLGVRGLTMSDRGLLGPQTGLGAFYHLDDHWSLRGDLQAMMNLDSRTAMIYSLAFGIQYVF